MRSTGGGISGLMSGATDSWVRAAVAVWAGGFLWLSACADGSAAKATGALSGGEGVGQSDTEASPAGSGSCSGDSLCGILRCCVGACGAPAFEDKLNNLCDERPLDVWAGCKCPEGWAPPSYAAEDTEFEHASCPEGCEVFEGILLRLVYEHEMAPCGPSWDATDEDFCAAYSTEACAGFVQGLKDSGFYAQVEMIAPAMLAPCAPADADAVVGD